MSILLIYLILFSLPPFSYAAEDKEGDPEEDIDVSTILNSLVSGYDRRLRPNYGGPPVEVGITMHVLSISSVSEVGMDFTMDFYFRQFWTDPRLSYKQKAGFETLSVGSEFLKNIWVPDTFFVNEKHSYFHSATTSNEFVRIHYTGSVTRSIRLTVTASCPMELQYFPMDRQLCSLEVESFGYTMRDIRYKWKDGIYSLGISKEVSLPQFKILGHRQRSMEVTLSTGNYSRLACDIQFVRSMGYYLIQIYIPSALIVIISWVSFWLNRNATPARVSLGVTTVLTMTTLMSSTNAALPKISYVKAIDIYLGTCFVMVFASLLEYATVGYMAKRIQMRKQLAAAARKRNPEFKLTIEDPSTATEAARQARNTLNSRTRRARSNVEQPRPSTTSSLAPNAPASHSSPVTPAHGLEQARLTIQTPRSSTRGSSLETLETSNTITTVALISSPPPTTPAHGPQPSRLSVPERKSSTEGSLDAPGTSHGTSFASQPSPVTPAHGSERARLKFRARRLSTIDSSLEASETNAPRINLDELDPQSLPVTPVPPPLAFATVPSLSHITPATSLSHITPAPSPSHITPAPSPSHITPAPSLSHITPYPSPSHIAPDYDPEMEAEPCEATYSSKNEDTIFGTTPSDIDKYSRVVFPVGFLCFNLMYWIIYMHVADVVADDLVLFIQDEPNLED